MRQERTEHADPAAEDAVISCAFMDSTLLDVIEGLEPTAFMRPSSACIFAAQLRLHGQGKPVDLVTVRAELDRMGDLQQAGGDVELLRLMENIPNLKAVEAYASRISELAQVRAVEHGLRKTLATLAAPIEDVPRFLASAQAELTEATTDPTADVRLVALSDVIPAVEADLQARQDRDGSTSITTGLKGLDDKLGAGMDPGWLMIVAGRPGMGKSALAQCTARAVSEASGPVLIFSLEMSREDWVKRLVLAEGSIDGANARTGSMNAAEWTAFRAAKAKLAKLPIRIDDTPGLSPHQLRSRARRAKAKGGLALIIVDYLQLMRTPHMDPKERDEAKTAEVSRSLKEVAKELGVPVLAIAQLNREAERRGGEKRPQVSDLRNSGQLEQDADVIALVYRPSFYFPKKHDPRDAEVIIGKNRHGASGTVKCRFEARFCRFEDFDPKTDQETGQRGWSADDYSDDKPWEHGEGRQHA